MLRKGLGGFIVAGAVGGSIVMSGIVYLFVTLWYEGVTERWATETS